MQPDPGHLQCPANATLLPLREGTDGELEVAHVKDCRAKMYTCC